MNQHDCKFDACFEDYNFPEQNPTHTVLSTEIMCDWLKEAIAWVKIAAIVISMLTAGTAGLSGLVMTPFLPAAGAACFGVALACSGFCWVMHCPYLYASKGYSHIQHASTRSNIHHHTTTHYHTIICRPQVVSKTKTKSYTQPQQLTDSRSIISRRIRSEREELLAGARYRKHQEQDFLQFA